MHRLLIVLLVIGCTPLTEEQRYERENALIEAREHYEQRKAACEDRGGVMMMKRDGITTRKYTKWDYSRAVCVRHPFY